MRVAVVNETSAVDKHPFITSALDGRSLDVGNAGMALKGGGPPLACHCSEIVQLATQTSSGF